MNTNIIELLNKIHDMPEDTLLEKIISYCEETDTDAQEIGEFLSEYEQFKRVLWADALKHNQIRDLTLKKRPTRPTRRIR